MSWPNFLEEHHIVSIDLWDKTFTDWLNPFNAIGNFGCHLNFTQLLDKQVA